jgi:hypothetical protein
MKAGFAELQRLYPKSDSILNAYAKFACMASDAASYREARARLRDRLSSLVWSEKVSLAHCNQEFAAEAAAAGGP